MRKMLTAALLMALAVLGTPAQAAQMLAVLNGDFNDDPFWDGWTVTIRYDTAVGVVTPVGGAFPGFQFQGTATQVHGVVQNRTTPAQPPFNPTLCPVAGPCPLAPATFDITNANLSIERTVDSYLFGFSGGGFSASGLGFDFRNICFVHPTASDCAPNPAGPVGSFDEPLLRTVNDDYGSWNISAAGVVNNMPHNHGVEAVIPLAIPEPATWATLILGAMAAGLALRRRRQVLRTA